MRRSSGAFPSLILPSLSIPEDQALFSESLSRLQATAVHILDDEGISLSSLFFPFHSVFFLGDLVTSSFAFRFRLVLRNLDFFTTLFLPGVGAGLLTLFAAKGFSYLGKLFLLFSAGKRESSAPGTLRRFCSWSTKNPMLLGGMCFHLVFGQLFHFFSRHGKKKHLPSTFFFPLSSRRIAQVDFFLRFFSFSLSGLPL